MRISLRCTRNRRRDRSRSGRDWRGLPLVVLGSPSWGRSGGVAVLASPTCHQCFVSESVSFAKSSTFHRTIVRFSWEERECSARVPCAACGGRALVRYPSCVRACARGASRKRKALVPRTRATSRATGPMGSLGWPCAGLGRSKGGPMGLTDRTVDEWPRAVQGWTWGGPRVVQGWTYGINRPAGQLIRCTSVLNRHRSSKTGIMYCTLQKAATNVATAPIGPP